jgi:hypothetical protein
MLEMARRRKKGMAPSINNSPVQGLLEKEA